MKVDTKDIVTFKNIEVNSMGKVAFVFSGQGAQKVGMAKDLFEYSSKVKKMFSLADSIRPGTSEQCFNGSKDELDSTVNTQPCLFCANVAASIVATQNNIFPDCIAGFSLGELCALYFAKALNFEDIFKIVCKRAQFMHESEKKEKGTMLAILKAEKQDILNLCKNFSLAYPANYNCPGQIVVSIKDSLAEEFSNEVKKLGATTIKLPVSGAFHSPFMDNASAAMKEYLSCFKFNSLELPIYSNVTATLYNNNFVDLISKQINHPVLWQNIIENMINDGVDTFIEIGVGQTLCNLIKKIDSTKKVLNIEDKESLNATVNALR